VIDQAHLSALFIAATHEAAFGIGLDDLQLRRRGDPGLSLAHSLGSGAKEAVQPRRASLLSPIVTMAAAFMQAVLS